MPIDVPHPDDAEFSPICAELARLFILHKHDMDLTDFSDAEIVARTSEITSTLIELGKVARERGDWLWLLRHGWFFTACGRLFAGDDAMARNPQKRG